MQNIPDPRQDAIVRKVLDEAERAKDPKAEAAHSMVTEVTPSQASKFIAVVKDRTQYAIGEHETAPEKLSPENREFLDRDIKPQLVKFIDNLNKIGLELEADVDQLMAVLEGLGDPTLDEVRTNFAQPEITLDLGKKLGDVKLLINKHFNPNGDKDKPDAVYCRNPDDPVWVNSADDNIGVFILEGPDEMAAAPNITGKKGNLGGERDAYVDELKAEQAGGVQVEHLTARQYLPWAAQKKHVDTKTYTLLRSEKGSPVVPTGDTHRGGVDLARYDAGRQLHALRRRRAAGGYVQKNKA